VRLLGTLDTSFRGLSTLNDRKMFRSKVTELSTVTSVNNLYGGVWARMKPKQAAFAFRPPKRLSLLSSSHPVTTTMKSMMFQALRK